MRLGRQSLGSPRYRPLLAWALATVLLALGATTTVYGGLRERAFDLLLRPGEPKPGSAAVVVVDIDRASLAAEEPWPWDRSRVARLLGAIGAGAPAAVAIDIVFEGADTRSPAALARRLREATGRAIDLGADLPDGDRELARALGLRPTTLGIVLDDARAGSPLPGGPPVLLSSDFDPSGLWPARGALVPPAELAGAAAGLGVVSLLADPDGRVRRVPLLALADERPLPGLPVDALRLAAGAVSLLVAGAPARLSAGAHVIPLGPDGMLRLVPRAGDARDRRAIPAHDVLSGRTPPSRFKDAIVLIGSSAPEAGGLRIAAGGELVPTLDLMADAVEQLAAGQVPLRPSWLLPLEATLLAAAVGAGFALAAALPPVTGAIAAAVGAVALSVPGIATIAAGDLLIDPVLAPAALILAFAGAAIVRGVADWQRAASLRRRLETQLPAEIVRRLTDNPELGRLAPETRTITVLSTDIEGFTRLVERNPAAAVVAMLDRYLALVTEVVERHGGIVDKFVGDAVLALFNAPLDLANHAERALDCAIDIRASTDALRTAPDLAALGLGPTRVGLESGPALVGDVGGRRLDYTAYGDAVNTAARLEAANKDLGSRIAVGAEAGRAIPAERLRPVGRITPRGRSDEMIVREPWPAAYSAQDREAYLAAFEKTSRDPAAAAAIYRHLATEHPGDRVLEIALARLGV